MNGLLFAIVGLRAAALALAASGNAKTAKYMSTLADLIEAGKATDEHMRLVAEKLKNGGTSEEDWNDLMARIDADHAALQN